ncbi:MAG TPA: NUDIX hydrolase, partial [Polyangium sp.]|nr:NUDIX hydrolase [Polyangium sp.]
MKSTLLSHPGNTHSDSNQSTAVQDVALHGPVPVKPTVGLFVSKNRYMLLLRRYDGPSTWKWDLPAGVMEPGETPEQAAQRVLKEQIGLDVKLMWRVFGAVPRIPGLETPDFLFEVAEFDGRATPSKAVVQYAWFSPGEIPQGLISDGLRDLLYRWLRARWGYGLQLYGVNQPIYSDGAKLVTEIGPPWPAEGLPPGVTVEKGTWCIEDDALSGSVVGRNPAICWFDAPVEGNQLMVFAAYAVPPHRNDINAYWEGSGALYGPDGACTISGFGGWYNQLTGIEYNPSENPLTVTKLAPVHAGVVYYLAVGRYGKSDFMFIDGELVTQLNDSTAPRRPS